jgi:fatty-acyl-CoA synthase
VTWLSMHTRFRPDAEALFDVETSRRWTYAQLEVDSRLWAGRLQSLGVVHGDRVALLAHNRGEHFALLFACQMLGAIFQPMNWRLSEGELAWQLGNAEPRVLLVDEHFAHLVPEDALRVEDGPGQTPGTPDRVAPEDPWVLMYTSGTTGKPKGALLTHRQMADNATNTLLACDLSPSDSTLTFTPLFHTGGLNSLSTPLFHRGGRVVLTRGVDASQALSLIQSEAISLLMGVPTIFQMLADHPDFEGADFSSVRDAFCGGAPLGLPLLERYLDAGIPLRQGFGMTEVGPNCFSMPMAETRRKLGSVGKLIHLLEGRLVKSDGSEAGVGEPGELWLRGSVVFGGYWRDAQATEKSLDEQGWFHTGDVLSQDAEGFFTVSGRLKEMFISGGENVYPAEVEASIFEAVPGISQCAVIGVPDARWGEVGRAFVEPEPGVQLDPEAIREALQGRLARFKRPKLITVREALPRTASGKIDKTALKQEALA